MKTKMVYFCEFCNPADRKYFDSESECEAHEATHFGLTKEEYNRWNILCITAAEAGKRCGYCKNEHNEKKFDEAIENLVQFETEHQLLDVKQKPSQFYR